MSHYAFYLLPVLFLGGICGILFSLSRRLTPPPAMPGLEERRLVAAVAAAELHQREKGSHVSADFVAAELARLRKRHSSPKP